MKKEEFVALGISEELAEKAATASAEELKGYIPKTRFDEVNEEKKNLQFYPTPFSAPCKSNIGTCPDCEKDFEVNISL